jgi:hypothetical protein
MFTNLLTLGFLASGLLLVYLMIRQRRLDVLHGNYLRQEADSPARTRGITSERSARHHVIPLTERYSRLRAMSREIAAAIEVSDTPATPVLHPLGEPNRSFDGSPHLHETARRRPL